MCVKAIREGSDAAGRGTMVMMMMIGYIAV